VRSGHSIETRSCFISGRIKRLGTTDVVYSPRPFSLLDQGDLEPSRVTFASKVYVVGKRKMVRAYTLTDETGAGRGNILKQDFFDANRSSIGAPKFLDQGSPRNVMHAGRTCVGSNQLLGCCEPEKRGDVSAMEERSGRRRELRPTGTAPEKSTFCEFRDFGRLADWALHSIRPSDRNKAFAAGVFCRENDIDPFRWKA